MSTWRTLMFALLCALLVLAPSLADARAGATARSGGSSMGYSSQGSLGSRTNTHNGGQAIERSATPQSSTGSPYYNRPGFVQSHPFLTGLFGGFVGSWIGSLLFPHWGMGYGVFGSLFSWLLIILAISFLFRMFRRGMATEPPVYGRGGPSLGGMGFGMGQGFGLGASAATTRPLTVDATDQAAFEAILKAVQGAWSKGDLDTLRHYATPEMLSYFRNDLATNTSQGVENHVENVELIRGDVRDAWDEGALQYATCLLHWRALDYTARVGRKAGDPDWLVDGDPRRPSEAQELWTFARSPGGHWLLSAIQQV
jgi:predicted lipid-binding transport protein (Tim44 family)